MVAVDTPPGEFEFGRGKPALKRLDCFVDPAVGEIFQPRAQQPRDGPFGSLRVRETGG